MKVVLRQTEHITASSVFRVPLQAAQEIPPSWASLLDKFLAAPASAALRDVEIALGIHRHRMDADELSRVMPHATDPAHHATHRAIQDPDRAATHVGGVALRRRSSRMLRFGSSCASPCESHTALPGPRRRPASAKRRSIERSPPEVHRRDAARIGDLLERVGVEDQEVGTLSGSDCSQILETQYPS